MTSQDSILEINDDSFVERVAQSEVPVPLAFCADSCPARQKLLASLSNALPRCREFVTIAKASPDESPGLAARFGVVPGPSLLLLRGGMVCCQFAGELSRLDLDDLLARARADSPTTSESTFNHGADRSPANR
jgi:thioredoxin-like negative regulator of GroEL